MNPQNSSPPIPLPFKIIGGIAGFVIACFASICVASALLPKPPAPVASAPTVGPERTAQGAQATAQPVAPPDPAPAAPAQPPAPAAAPAPDVPVAAELPPGFHRLHETWRLGCCEYTATAASAEGRVGGRFMRQNASPGAIFLELRYTETNLSGETVHAAGGNVRLVDAHGRRFDESSRAMSAIEMSEEMQMLPELQPNLPRQGVAAFEVPADVVDGAMDFEFTERGLLGTDTATVRLVSSASDRAAVHRGR